MFAQIELLIKRLKYDLKIGPDNRINWMFLDAHDNKSIGKLETMVMLGFKMWENSHVS